MIECGLGYWCAGGKRRKCPKGTANAKTKQNTSSACIPCEAGSYNTLQGQYMCPFTCASGTYMAAAPAGGAQNDDSCVDCPAGSYCPQRGMTEPLFCPAGTYLNSTGSKKSSDLHQLSLVAMTDGSIFRISKKDFVEFIENNPGAFIWMRDTLVVE